MAAVGVVPLASRTPLFMVTVIPPGTVAFKMSPDLKLVMLTRMPAMLPPFASSAKLGARKASWLEIVAIGPVVKVGKNQRLAFESV